MAEVEVGLGAVVGDEHFAVLIRRHRARIDVDVRVELQDADGDAARLEQSTNRRDGDPLANRRNNSAGDEDVLRRPRRSRVIHGLTAYQSCGSVRAFRRPAPAEVGTIGCMRAAWWRRRCGAAGARSCLCRAAAVRRSPCRPCADRPRCLPDAASPPTAAAADQRLAPPSPTGRAGHRTTRPPDGAASPTATPTPPGRRQPRRPAAHSRRLTPLGPRSSTSATSRRRRRICHCRPRCRLSASRRPASTRSRRPWPRAATAGSAAAARHRATRRRARRSLGRPALRAATPFARGAPASITKIVDDDRGARTRPGHRDASHHDRQRHGAGARATDRRSWASSRTTASRWKRCCTA